jgi:hypothetical protein
VPGDGSYTVPKYGFSMTAIIWMSMAAVNYPFAMWGELLCDPYHGLYYCATGATIDPGVLCLYLVLARIINYIIPLLFIWTAYIGIACKLWYSPVKVKGYTF